MRYSIIDILMKSKNGVEEKIIMMKNIKTFTLMGLAAALAFGHPVASYAGQWNAGTGENTGRWWYDNGNGSYAANGGQWIDGNNDGIAEYYCFDENGWLLTNTVTKDGYLVNEDGVWVDTFGSIQVRADLGYGDSTVDNVDNAYVDYDADEEDSVSDLVVDDDERWNREMAEEFVELLNEYREKNGNDPVELTDDAQYYSEVRAMQLVDNFSHRVEENDYIEDTYGIEFCTGPVTSVKDAIKQFKGSDPHWRGLTGEDGITECGVGFYRMDNGKYMVCVNFNDIDEEGYMFADYIK